MFMHIFSKMITPQTSPCFTRDLSLQAVRDVLYGTSLSGGILSTLVQRAFNRDPEIRGNCCMSRSRGMLRECRFTPGTFRGCWNVGGEAVMDLNGAQSAFQRKKSSCVLVRMTLIKMCTEE